jgi:ubiquinone/menaquinone biosynthesis C-methylase UbiE
MPLGVQRDTIHMLDLRAAERDVHLTFQCPGYQETTMADSHQSAPRSDFPRGEWVRIHNDAAREYKVSEWTREVLMGTRARRKQLFSRASGKVLDVACGYGLNFAYLPNATSMSGVDFSPVMLAMARDHVRALGLPVSLSEGDAEALISDNTFDTVISALSTCSFLNPIVALQEMRRVCKPGGRILLVEHGRSDWEWVGRYQDRNGPSMLRQAGCHWNQEPQELVREAGIEISRLRALLGVFHTIGVARKIQPDLAPRNTLIHGAPRRGPRIDPSPEQIPSYGGTTDGCQ